MIDRPQPPRLQDTTERSALPVPLPGAPDTMAFAAASAGDEEASTEESDAVPDVDPEAAAPIPDEPAPAGDSAPADDGQPDLDPVFAPPAAEQLGGEAAEGGPAPEVLVGAAFLGGVALAFLIKRLGS